MEQPQRITGKQISGCVYEMRSLPASAWCAQSKCQAGFYWRTGGSTIDTTEPGIRARESTEKQDLPDQRWKTDTDTTSRLKTDGLGEGGPE